MKSGIPFIYGLLLLQLPVALFSQTNTQVAAPKDIIINEILYRPPANASEYIEYYNGSDKTFDISKLSIANRNTSGAISSVKTLSQIPLYIFPGEYFVVTEDSASLTTKYLVKNPDHIITMSPMPSLANTAGYALLLNANGEVIDEVHYDSKWQYGLLNSDIGVALERIDPAGPSQEATNWHSAAATAGYGTPTYRNSQYKTPGIINATVAVNPAVFSPDNDGRDDIAAIQYAVNDRGYIANITIFNAVGRPVRYLIKNGLLGPEGYWNWNGLDEKGVLLPAGPYIILTELFNMQGKRQRFKNVLILANAIK